MRRDVIDRLAVGAGVGDRTKLSVFVPFTNTPARCSSYVLALAEKFTPAIVNESNGYWPLLFVLTDAPTFGPSIAVPAAPAIGCPPLLVTVPLNDALVGA